MEVVNISVLTVSLDSSAAVMRDIFLTLTILPAWVSDLISWALKVQAHSAHAWLLGKINSKTIHDRNFKLAPCY